MKDIREKIENNFYNQNDAFSYCFSNYLILPFCARQSEFELEFESHIDTFLINKYPSNFDKINHSILYDDQLFPYN